MTIADSERTCRIMISSVRAIIIRLRHHRQVKARRALADITGDNLFASGCRCSQCSIFAAAALVSCRLTRKDASLQPALRTIGGGEKLLFTTLMPRIATINSATTQRPRAI